jgi:hypothetical protein
MSDYTPNNVPILGARGAPSVIRNEFQDIADAIATKLDQSEAAGELDLKANIDSPTFTGVPAAPTAAPGTNTTQLATTAFAAAIAALKADINNPTFTGIPAAPTATPGTNTTQLATTAFVAAIEALKANINSPTFTGTPAAPTASAGTNTTQLATTAFVQIKADIDSPTFTGNPAAPTPTLGDSSTKLATTAFVAGTSLAASLPGQAGNKNKVISTDGTAASWQPAYAAIFAGISVTSYAYTSGSLTEITHVTGNKQLFAYTSGNLTSVQYTDTDGTTVLATNTLAYTDGVLTSSTWS